MTKTQTISVLIALITWMLISLLFVISIVGLLLFVRSDNSCSAWEGDDGISSWNKIGIGLYKKLIS